MAIFVCRFGTFRFEVTSFGLMNFRSTTQRMTDHRLSGLRLFLVYLDNVVVFSKNIDEHNENLKVILDV